jgi:hypothetical protein
MRILFTTTDGTVYRLISRVMHAGVFHVYGHSVCGCYHTEVPASEVTFQHFKL